jgi:hypothetical protein
MALSCRRKACCDGFGKVLSSLTGNFSDEGQKDVRCSDFETSTVQSRKTPKGEMIMSEYVFLYRGGSRDGSPTEMQQLMQKWVSWLKGLAEKGHIKDQGQPLERTGKLVTGRQKTVTDGPFAEAKDVIGGYTLVEARDLDQAVELSKGCPIFERDGTVEVRPVMKM